MVFGIRLCLDLFKHWPPVLQYPRGQPLHYSSGFSSEFCYEAQAGLPQACKIKAWGGGAGGARRRPAPPAAPPRPSSYRLGGGQLEPHNKIHY